MWNSHAVALYFLVSVMLIYDLNVLPDSIIINLRFNCGRASSDRRDRHLTVTLLLRIICMRAQQLGKVFGVAVILNKNKNMCEPKTKNLRTIYIYTYIGIYIYWRFPNIGIIKQSNTLMFTN